jgi:predicted dithiol-disulfide oxidoreductase (DUF899 family)
MTVGRGRKVKLSELFAPGNDALVIYNYMFPRHAGDLRPEPRTGESATLPLAEGPCPVVHFGDRPTRRSEPQVGAHGNLVVAAKAPIERVATFGRIRVWRHIRLLSSGRNSFARDYKRRDRWDADADDERVHTRP